MAAERVLKPPVGIGLEIVVADDRSTDVMVLIFFGEREQKGQ